MKPFPILYALVLAALTMLPIKASAIIPSIKITEMTVTTRIFRGEPIDSVKRVSSGAFKGLYCFTRGRVVRHGRYIDKACLVLERGRDRGNCPAGKRRTLENLQQKNVRRRLQRYLAGRRC